jgi:hypothetical protein
MSLLLELLQGGEKQVVSKIKITRKLKVRRGFRARHCAQGLRVVKFAASKLRFLRHEL